MGILAGRELAVVCAGVVGLCNAQPAWPSGEDLAPLAGAADLTRVLEAERADFLASIGADPQRPEANVVVLGLPPDTPWPDGTRFVARDYQTSTRGNVGVAIRLSVRLGR